MQKIFLSFFFAGFLFSAFTQMQFGIKGGVNFATIANSNGVRININAGLFDNIILQNQFSFQPELVYSAQGSTPALLGGNSSSQLNLNYISIPVLLKYKSPSGFFVESGPAPGVLLSAKSKYGGQDTNEKNKFKAFDFSWAIGIGYISKFNLGINARYNFGILNINNDADNSFDYRNNVFQLGLFYLFAKSNKKK